MERVSKPGQSRTGWGHSARDRWRNRTDNSVRVVDHDGCRRYGSPLHRKRDGASTLLNGGEDAGLVIRLQRITAGDRARFFHSHFGQQVVEL